MKLVSWNVNGFRACLEKGFLKAFQKLDADVFCLQETKMQKGQIDFRLADYEEYWNSAEKKGYSGTAVFSRIRPEAEYYGLGRPEHDNEGRVITLKYADFFLVNTYTPNSQRGLTRLAYRMQWEDAFRAYLEKLNKDRPVIVCGDLNVAHQEIDLRNPKSNQKNAGFTLEERNKMTALLESGFTDTFRALHPQQEEAYSWWSYRNNARVNNIGWRIDYFLVSQRLMTNVKSASIYSEITGSDHCPVALELLPG